jgi:hypothetical protein
MYVISQSRVQRKKTRVLYPEHKKLKRSKFVNKFKILIFERYKCMPNNKSDTIEIQSGNYVQKRVKKAY